MCETFAPLLHQKRVQSLERTKCRNGLSTYAGTLVHTPDCNPEIISNSSGDHSSSIETSKAALIDHVSDLTCHISFLVTRAIHDLLPTLKIRYRIGKSFPANGRLVSKDFWIKRCALSAQLVQIRSDKAKTSNEGFCPFTINSEWLVRYISIIVVCRGTNDAT